RRRACSPPRTAGPFSRSAIARRCAPERRWCRRAGTARPISPGAWGSRQREPRRPKRAQRVARQRRYEKAESSVLLLLNECDCTGNQSLRGLARPCSPRGRQYRRQADLFTLRPTQPKRRGDDAMKANPWTLTLTAIFACSLVQAQTWKVPAESMRCPSKWGAADERGSNNHMKPASVLRAKQLIQ